jgi:GNAT superfamily N-acetyltransferase
MPITFRTVTPEEITHIISIIENGYNIEVMPHFKWRLLDSPEWDYTHSVVGEVEGTIATVGVLEPQTVAFLKNTLDAVIGGGVMVHKDFRRRGFYKKVVNACLDTAKTLKKDLLIGYAQKDQFAYPSLKKIGFYHIFSQVRYIKILNVREAFKVAVDILNQRKHFDGSFAIRIVPKNEEPFIIQLQKIFSLCDNNNCDIDIEISGDIKQVLTIFASGNLLKIVPLLLKRKVRISFGIQSVPKVIHLIKQVIP